MVHKNTRKKRYRQRKRTKENKNIEGRQAHGSNESKMTKTKVHVVKRKFLPVLYEDMYQSVYVSAVESVGMLCEWANMWGCEWAEGLMMGEPTCVSYRGTLRERTRLGSDGYYQLDTVLVQTTSHLTEIQQYYLYSINLPYI